MVQVRVAGVAMDAVGNHVILLKPLDALPGEGRVLPIWIGAQEATSILLAIDGAEVPRPMSHDLMRAMLASLDANVARVEVTRVEEGTFFAEVTVAGAGVVTLDARPSDAIALASRTGAPIFVADDVLAVAGIVDITAEGDGDAEGNVEEFRRFLDDVDPDDFRE